MEPKYPNIHVFPGNTNAFAIMAAVVSALRKANVTPERIAEYIRESKSGSYDNLIQTAKGWVNLGASN